MATVLGSDISLGTMVAVILALVALLFVILFVTGQFDFIKSITSFISGILGSIK